MTFDLRSISAERRKAVGLRTGIEGRNVVPVQMGGGVITQADVTCSPNAGPEQCHAAEVGSAGSGQRRRKRAMCSMCRGAGTQAEAAYNKLVRIKNGTSKTVRALQGADAWVPSGPLGRRSE